MTIKKNCGFCQIMSQSHICFLVSM